MHLSPNGSLVLVNAELSLSRMIPIEHLLLLIIVNRVFFKRMFEWFKINPHKFPSSQLNNFESFSSCEFEFDKRCNLLQPIS